MSNAKRLKDNFTWVPHHLRASKFGGQRPPQKVDNRMPLLWLARDGGELYFVNMSNETLPFVGVTDYRDCTDGEDDNNAKNQSPYVYHEVHHGEAVKIDEFDGMYDLDYLLQAHIYISSSQFGNVRFNTPPEKGQVSECVLVWQSGELGKDIGIISLTD